MINKNMIEKSIVSLKTNIPKFVRNSYTQFTEIFKRVVDIVDKLSETNPYTANKLADEIMSGLPLLKVLKATSA